MANSTLLHEIAANLTVSTTPSWADMCISALNASTTYNWRSGLVDGSGNPIDGLTQATWGVDMATCYEYCSTKTIPYVLLIYTIYLESRPC